LQSVSDEEVIEFHGERSYIIQGTRDRGWGDKIKHSV
jgi:hypothetical protein